MASQDFLSSKQLEITNKNCSCTDYGLENVSLYNKKQNLSLHPLSKSVLVLKPDRSNGSRYSVLCSQDYLEFRTQIWGECDSCYEKYKEWYNQTHKQDHDLLV